MLYHTYGLSNSQQHGQMGKSVISTTPLIAWSGINPHLGNIVVSSHKTLNNDCLCLSALNKQKTQQTRIWRNSLEHWINENSKTGADSSKHKVVNAVKSVRINPQLASDAVRWQENKYRVSIKSVCTLHLKCTRTLWTPCMCNNNWYCHYSKNILLW